MNWSEIAKVGLLPGALAGLLGGVVFALSMSAVGQLPMFAQMPRVDSTAVGFTLILAVAVILGAGFGIF